MRRARSFRPGNAVPFAASYNRASVATPNYKATFVFMMLAGIGGGIAAIGFTDGFQDAKQREEAAYNSDFHGFHNVLHHVAAGLTVFAVAVGTFAIGFGANKGVRACVERSRGADTGGAFGMRAVSATPAGEGEGLLGSGNSGATARYAGWRANCTAGWSHPATTGVLLTVVSAIAALAAVAETTGVKQGWQDFAETPYAHVVGAGMFVLLAGATVGGLGVAVHAAGVVSNRLFCGDRRGGNASGEVMVVDTNDDYTGGGTFAPGGGTGGEGGY